MDRYFAVTDRIAQNPEVFPVKFDDYRRVLVPQSHLAVYYFVEPEQSVIAALIDARRHPRLIRDLIRTRRQPTATPAPRLALAGRNRPRSGLPVYRRHTSKVANTRAEVRTVNDQSDAIFAMPRLGGIPKQHRHQDIVRLLYQFLLFTIDGQNLIISISLMATETTSEAVWFTTKGQVVIPLRLRKLFHIEEGTKAVIEATPEGILLKPVTRHSINRLRGILKRKPGAKPFAEEWAEHKREELELEERKHGSRTSS